MATSFFSTSIGLGYYQFLLTIFPDPAQRHDQARWSDSTIRWLRYQYLWSFYDQSIFWGYQSEILKREFGLYRNIRPQLNPIQRLIEFHVTHTLGGAYDREAGDGKKRPSSLPIILGKTAKPELRNVIAKLWKVSNWSIEKSTYVRLGATLGDVGLELIDDAALGTIRMRVIHPSEIKSATFDQYGNLRTIILERFERDPESKTGDQIVVYKEEVTKQEKGVHYQTYRDGQLYQWPGTEGSVWDVELPFIPIVLTQHINMGFPWGFSEIAMALNKTIEIEDQSSNLSDGNRQMVKGPWLLTGGTLGNVKQDPWGDDPFTPQVSSWDNFFQLKSAQISNRADIPILEFINKDVSMKPLVMPLPVADIVQWIDKINSAIERDFPELEVDTAQASGDASGRALRVARQKVSQKIQERRVAYEEKLVRAQMMACVMGAILGYEGFEPFTKNSFDDGTAEHFIGEHSVFAADPMETIAYHQARATAIMTYIQCGFPLRSAMEQVDFAAEDIDTILALKEQEDEQDIESDRESELPPTSGPPGEETALSSAGPSSGSTAEVPPDIPEMP